MKQQKIWPYLMLLAACLIITPSIDFIYENKQYHMIIIDVYTEQSVLHNYTIPQKESKKMELHLASVF